uniref:imidazolonepropionase-like domain-containing protein n=1 Tax=Rhodosalinus sp. TaxID=2047741 RepID=UPI00398332D4
MAERLLRGRLLSFRRRPEGPGDTAALEYHGDGGLLLRDGRIAAKGDFAELRRQAPEAAVTDHRPHLILPGFIDPHIHFPQLQVVASWGAELLDWLETYTFPA